MTMFRWKICLRSSWYILMLLLLSAFLPPATGERETGERCEYKRKQGELEVTIVQPLSTAVGYIVLVERQDDYNIFYEEFHLSSKSETAFVYDVPNVSTDEAFQYDVSVRPHGVNPSNFLGQPFRTCHLHHLSTPVSRVFPSPPLVPPPLPPSSTPSPPVPADGGQPGSPGRGPAIRPTGDHVSPDRRNRQTERGTDRRGTETDIADWTSTVMWVVVAFVGLSFIVFLSVLIAYVIKRWCPRSDPVRKAVTLDRRVRNVEQRNQQMYGIIEA